MSSTPIQAFLYLEGYPLKLPIDVSRWGSYQQLDHRGRPASRVRYKVWWLGLSGLTRAQKQQLAALATSDTATVTVYAEFSRGDGQGVEHTLWAKDACLCHFTHSFDTRTPQQWRAARVYVLGVAAEQMGMEPGAWGTFATPPPREYAYSGPALEREAEDTASTGTGGPPAAGGAPSSGLAALIKNCICIDEPEAFRATVLADLEKIYATPTGKKLLESLAKSGKTVDIEYSMGNNSMLSYDHPAARFFQADGSAGAGSGCKIGYNPAKEYISDMEWGTRPPAIGLAHELIHAEQAAYGRMCIGQADNDGRMDGGNPTKPLQEDIRELEAVGIPPQDGYQFSENKIRAEWTPIQPERKWY